MRVVLFPIVIGILSVAASGDDRIPKADPNATGRIADTEEPISIFNEEIRRFRFKIENENASIEMAMGIMQSYFGDEKSGVIGAYPDRLTNSLVFIASPEAETAIRKALATRMIEIWGIPDGPPTPLESQRQFLERERRDQLAELAVLECELVEHEESKNQEVIDRFLTLLDEARKKLKVIERKIEVVEKYLKLQEEKPNLKRS